MDTGYGIDNNCINRWKIFVGSARGVGKACKKELSVSDGEDQSAIMPQNPNFSTLEATSMIVKVNVTIS